MNEPMKLARPLAILVALAAASAVAALAACTSDTSHSQPPAGCAGAPFTCPMGQTCAVANQQLEMQCVVSGPGKAGDMCQNTLDGNAECGDGLFCLQAPPTATMPVTAGVCTPYCDPMHPCTAPATCKEAQIVANGLSSPIVNICFSGFPVLDGGTDAPATDAPPADAPPAVDAPPAQDSGADAPADAATE